MANFFEGIWEGIKHPLNEGQFMWDVMRGKTSLKDAPGEHQEMMNKVTVPILGDNKISKNSDAVAGTIVGGVLAAPALGSMFGSGGTGGYGTEGIFDKLFSPSGKGEISQGLMSGFENNLGSGLDYGAGDGLLTNSSGSVGGISGSSLPDLDLSGAGGGVDLSNMEGIMKALKSIKAPEKQQVSSSRAGGGGFRGNSSKNLAQSLLDREYEKLYMAPLYKKYTKDAY